MMKSPLRATLLATVLASSLVACVSNDDPPAAVRTAIPTADQVQIKLPESTARAVGDLAVYYAATRNVTRAFNGGSAWVLTLVHTIVQFPVTTVDGNVYTWGPWSNALDPAEYKLEVTALADGTFDYQLSGRNKSNPGAAFEVVIDGHADPRPGPLSGNGSFLLDFDAGARVNPVDNAGDRGTISAGYDLAQRHLDLAIDSVDDRGEVVSADYAYNETAAGGGDMVFVYTTDAGGTPAEEQATLRSRWLPTGAGRADARLSGGDLQDGATASECWSDAFRRVYYTDSVIFSPTEGDPTACAFPTADLPPL